jgi:chaperonin GroES
MATATAKKVKIRPLDDRIVVEPFEAEETTAGGIVLPDTAREKPQQGKVIAVGPGKLMESTGNRATMSVKTGDAVFYGKYSGTEVEVGGETYVIMRESDVLAVQD